MRNRRGHRRPGALLGTALATVAMVVALAGCSLTPGAASAPSGQAQREALIGSLTEAIQRSDAAAIAGMTGPLVDPRADIAALLDAHGGRPWENVRVAWGPDDFGGTGHPRDDHGDDTRRPGLGPDPHVLGHAAGDNRPGVGPRR